MMVSTNDTPSPDVESPLVRLRAEIVGTTNVPLVTNDNLSDIFFICGDDFYPIQSHRLILRNWSCFFEKVVNTSLSIKGPFPVAPFIVLKEVCGKDLQDIFKFIYNGEVSIERSRIGSLLRTARFLEINQLPDLLEASEELRDDINAYNEISKDSIASIKSSEATIINSDAASKCSEMTIIHSDAISKSSGRTSNNSIETNKSSDDGSDVSDVNASLNVNMSPVSEEKSAKNVEEKSLENFVENSSENVSGTLEKKSDGAVEENKSKLNRTKSLDRVENPSSATNTNSQIENKSPPLSLEERLRRHTLFFSSVFRLPKAIEPVVEPLKPEKDPPQPMDKEEVIDLTLDQS